MRTRLLLFCSLLPLAGCDSYADDPYRCALACEKAGHAMVHFHAKEGCTCDTPPALAAPSASAGAR